MGAFDGVHRGHQLLLQKLQAKGRELGLPTTVVIFEPLPREFLAPAKAAARLMSFQEKFIALRELGIDRVLRIRFTPKLRDLRAEEFVRKVLVEGLGIQYIVVGDDLHFGRNRSGNFDMMQAAGEKYGFEVESTSTLKECAERISSTRIRKALADNDFQLAEKLLGHPYSLMGRVVVGNKLGRELNAPTANVQLRRINTALSGVYAVLVYVMDGKRGKNESGKNRTDEPHFGVANVGMRPTVGDLDKPILEVHILDFDRTIYGRKIKVVFKKKLREEKAFASLDLLKTQIHADMAEARRYFELPDMASE